MVEAQAVEGTMTLGPWKNPELWERLKPLFQAAMEMPEQDRAHYVDEVCGGDRELRAALEDLVRAKASPQRERNGALL
jgi:hypothetical protein